MTLPCYVYELIDPRDGLCFYIGITVAQTGRYYAHCSDPTSAAYERIQAIKACGLKPLFNEIAEFETREEALDYEAYLIEKTPDLVNRTGPKVKPTKHIKRPVTIKRAHELVYVPTEEFELEGIVYD